MSATGKAGGPAFPRIGHNRIPDMQHDYHEAQEGMSLRDYFAGQALAGIMAQPDTRFFSGISTDKAGLLAWRQEIFKSDAECAFVVADAMIAARETSP